MNISAIARFLEVPESTVRSWAVTFAEYLSPGVALENYSARDRTLLKKVRDWKQNEPHLSDFEIGQRLYSLRNSTVTNEPQEKIVGHMYYPRGSRRGPGAW